MAPSDPLIALAEHHGVLPTYTDMHGQPCTASPESLRAVLGALGVDSNAVPDPDPPALPPLQVRWTDDREPLDAPTSATSLALTSLDASATAMTLPVVDGRAALPHDLAPGRYAVTAGEDRGFLLLAPRGCWRPDPDPRVLGVFIPHHALHDQHSRGLGDFSTLARLGAQLADRGARVLATLPLLPTFLHREPPYEPSPYAPVSRMFWAEHLIDPTAAPEWATCTAARDRLDRARADGTLDALTGGDLVDPAGAWALTRELLGALAATAWADPSTAATLQAWADADSNRFSYARFRAATERWGPWPTWARSHDGPDRPGVPVDLAEERFWIYAQHQAGQQLRALRDGLAARGVALYLDLPIGVHPDGFDTWRWGDRVFARQISAGAPPDPYFPSGQDWGFPPMHPTRSAHDDGLDYLLACLRAHAGAAHLLRLDHVMGFYRLFWVPRGLGATAGVYVRYPAEAWWAALCLASREHGCAVVGENLGIVPPEVDATLAALDVRGMAVGQFHLTHDPHHPIRPIPHGAVASLNTHDTPTFAGWWAGEDLDTVQDLGWFSAERAGWEREGRQVVRRAVAPLAARGALADRAELPEPLRVAAGLYAALAESPAHLLLVNLEDLWAEERPHNVPGTWRERPNWLRRASRSLEQIGDDPVVALVLRDLAARMAR